MRAARVHAPGDLRIEEVPAPQTGRTGVVIRVVYGGICGSDLHYWQHARNGIYRICEPLTLGHEIVGVVDAIGPDAQTEVMVGQAVAIHPATPTPPPGGVRGRGLNIAVGGGYLGSASTTPHTQGGYAERLLVTTDQLRALPSGLPLRRAALAEPLAVSLHGVDQAGDVAGKRVLVSGAGPIGSLAVAALRRRGAAHITAADLKRLPLDIALAVGADDTVLLGVDRAPEPESYDTVIEASGSPLATSAALRAVRRGGTVVQLGMLPDGVLEVVLAALVSKEICLQGSQRFDVELDEAVAMLAETSALDAVITQVFPLEAAVEAFETASDSSRSSKVLLQVSADDC